jgi:hypothetical protein
VPSLDFLSFWVEASSLADREEEVMEWPTGEMYFKSKKVIYWAMQGMAEAKKA